MSTTPAPQPAEQVRELLLRLAQLTALKKQIEAEQQGQIEAITSATLKALAPTEQQIKDLEQTIKSMAQDHKAILFVESRTLKAQQHTVSLRSTTVYEPENEEETIAMLEHVRDNDPDEANRLAAAACLRTHTELNKTFVRDNWKRFSGWFENYFGFRKIERDSVSIKIKPLPTAQA